MEERTLYENVATISVEDIDDADPHLLFSKLSEAMEDDIHVVWDVERQEYNILIEA